jgi:DNA-binding CsgD family transcriptional regulator
MLIPIDRSASQAMPGADRRALTSRERAVLDGIDRRLPLKAVAAELGVSESRVNQHVRALKEHYRVHNLPDLIEAWRRQEPDFQGEATYRNSAWRIPQVHGTAAADENESRVAPGEFVLADAAPFAIEAPWMTRIEPRVVPGMLDGDNAVLMRLALIVGLAFGLVAAIVLVVTASLSLSEALDGKAAVPESGSSPAG